MGGHSRAIVIDQNRGIARRISRVLVSAGYVPEIREPGEGLPIAADRDGAAGLFLVGDIEAREEICRELRALGPAAVGALYGAGELDAAALLGEPTLQALLSHRGSQGRLDLEAELLGLARHLRGAPLPPLQGLLLWGAQAFGAEIHNVAGREAAVGRVVALCQDELGAPRRVTESVGEVAHELITNAMYDAPVDDGGALRYNRDRTAPIELPPDDHVSFRFGTDGLRLAIEAEDRFGRLRRGDLIGSLRRGAAGRVSQDEGGAGIGLSRVLRACQSVVVDVEPGRRTRVTALVELDPPRPVDGVRTGHSLVFPERPPARGDQREQAAAVNYEDRTSLIQAGQAPPKVLIERRESGQVLCLRLSGSIDEQFDGPGLARTLHARWLVLDLGGIDRISSFGIRQWIDFIGATSGSVEAVFFVEVSPKMVDQFNMVANFGGPGQVVSFFAPYRCDTCDHDRRRLFRTDEETPLWKAGQAPAFPCTTCGNQEYFDEDPATYFSYVAQQAPAPLPPDVVAFLRSELSYGQGGQRKLKIEKRVDGRTTYVKLSGDLDSDLRAQKLAEGLEGEVVFDLGGLLSIDPVGTAQWRKLMQLLDAKSGAGVERVERVHLLAAPALFLERLGRPEDLTRKGQVLSVLVPYTCPRCRATTQRLVDFAAHSNELRAGRVPRTQCSACGGPASCVASETWLTRLAALPQPLVDESMRQTIARLSAPPAPQRPSVPVLTGAPQGRSWPPPGAAPSRPELTAPPADRTRDTRPLGLVRFAWLRARGRELIEVPGLIPGLLVVLLALSAAIVYRILSPPEGRRNAAGMLIIEASEGRSPPWATPQPRRPGELVFVGQSPLLPDRQQAIQGAEGAALSQLAQHLGEVLAQRNASWRDAVWSLYDDTAQGTAPPLARLRAQEAERRVASLLRQAPGGVGRPEIYWEKLGRGERREARELAYQATARIELGRAAFDRLATYYGQAESCQRATIYPYFPMLGWRFDLPAGAVVAQADPQGRLGAAGVLPRDVIVTAFGRDVEGAQDLCRRLEGGPADGAVLKVQRGERLLDVSLSPKGRRPKR